MKQKGKPNYVKVLQNKKGWGIESVPDPKEEALIEARWDLCIGCGYCEVACSMFHYGVINRELSRIRIYRYLLPAPKSVQNICCQCSAEERECEKACPLDPPVIHYDKEKFHMVVDEDRCLGAKCGKCLKACPAKVPRFYPSRHKHAMVCDLCEKDGVRRPQCVEVCPSFALEFMEPQFPQHMQRIHPDEKAACMSERMKPLTPHKAQITPEELFGGER
ncbi:MAG: 4Fe-4S dicluster domain-containing protein [Deltaproteobacteria bacterium]|nr:4Fe-4S dicluster domain-containing protein [Deltaproteobacteria bacterium]